MPKGPKGAGGMAGGLPKAGGFPGGGLGAAGYLHLEYNLTQNGH